MFRAIRAGLARLRWEVQRRNLSLRASKRLSRRGLYEFLEEQFAQIASGAEVLSVGAGGPVNDLLGAHARRAGFTVTTVDVDPDRGPDLVGDLCVDPLPEQAYEVVVLSEVLEHTYDPGAALGNIHRALRPGGRLVLTVPFIFPIHNRPRDYYRFTRYGLEHLLGDFSEVSIRERNSWPEAINVLLVRLLKEPGRAARLATPLFIGLAYLLEPLARGLGRLVPADHLTTGYDVTATRDPVGTRSAPSSGK